MHELDHFLLKLMTVMSYLLIWCLLCHLVLVFASKNVVIFVQPNSPTKKVKSQGEYAGLDEPGDAAGGYWTQSQKYEVGDGQQKQQQQQQEQYEQPEPASSPKAPSKEPALLPPSLTIIDAGKKWFRRRKLKDQLFFVFRAAPSTAAPAAAAYPELEDMMSDDNDGYAADAGTIYRAASQGRSIARKASINQKAVRQSMALPPKAAVKRTPANTPTGVRRPKRSLNFDLQAEASEDDPEPEMYEKEDEMTDEYPPPPADGGECKDDSCENDDGSNNGDGVKSYTIGESGDISKTPKSKAMKMVADIMAMMIMSKAMESSGKRTKPSPYPPAMMMAAKYPAPPSAPPAPAYPAPPPPPSPEPEMSPKPCPTEMMMDKLMQIMTMKEKSAKEAQDYKMMNMKVDIMKEVMSMMSKQCPDKPCNCPKAPPCYKPVPEPESYPRYKPSPPVYTSMSMVKSAPKSRLSQIEYEIPPPPPPPPPQHPAPAYHPILDSYPPHMPAYAPHSDENLILQEYSDTHASGRMESPADYGSMITIPPIPISGGSGGGVTPGQRMKTLLKAYLQQNPAGKRITSYVRDTSAGY